MGRGHEQGIRGMVLTREDEAGICSLESPEGISTANLLAFVKYNECWSSDPQTERKLIRVVWVTRLVIIHHSGQRV